MPQDAPTDRALLDRFRSGDPTAFEELYRRYRRYVTAIVRLILAAARVLAFLW